MKYRKKPVVIEAIRLPSEGWGTRELDMHEAGGVMGWLVMQGVDFTVVPDGLNIATLEGVMHAEMGDWVIRGVAGEFYPCKPDIFERTYEPVETADV